MPRSRRKNTPKQITEQLTAAKDSFQRETVVMFVDIMGASEVSNHMTPADYAAFVNSFQQLFNETCQRYVKTWLPVNQSKYAQYSARGDEGLLIIYEEPDAAPAGVDSSNQHRT